MDFHTYTLDRHEAQQDADHTDQQRPSIFAWHVITTAWDDYANNTEELAELLAAAISDGLQAQINEVPF